MKYTCTLILEPCPNFAIFEGVCKYEGECQFKAKKQHETTNRDIQKPKEKIRK